MISKKALQTIGYTLVLGASVFAVALFSPGVYARRLIAPGILIVLGGLPAALGLAIKGKKVDRECDEREGHISSKSMAFTFYVMSLVLLINWATDFANTGRLSFVPLLILVLFWGSFGLAYLFYKIRN